MFDYVTKPILTLENRDITLAQQLSQADERVKKEEYQRMISNGTYSG